MTKGRAITKFEPLLDENGDVIEGCFSATVNDVVVGAVGKTCRKGVGKLGIGPCSGWGWVVTPGDKGSADRYSWSSKTSVWPTRRNAALALYVASQITTGLDIDGTVDSICDVERRIDLALYGPSEVGVEDLRLVLETLETTRDTLEEVQVALDDTKEDLQTALDTLKEVQAELKVLKGKGREGLS